MTRVQMNIIQIAQYTDKHTLSDYITLQVKNDNFQGNVWISNQSLMTVEEAVNTSKEYV